MYAIRSYYEPGVGLRLELAERSRLALADAEARRDDGIVKREGVAA